MIPSIVEVFPRDTSTITIQLNGASAHNVSDYMYVCWAITESNLPIKLEKQPPQSLDLNVLDLRYFTSIQGLQNRKDCEDVKDLVTTVKESFEQLEVSKLTNVWLTLQLVMLVILRVGGDNTYNLPHINKIKLEREGKLSTEVLVSEEDMSIINDNNIGINQFRITRYYPQITYSHSKYLIEI